MKDWKQEITERIAAYVTHYRQESGTAMSWKAPLVGFADAHAPEFHQLKAVVHKEHVLPQDLLAEATIVVAYFLPYPEAIVSSNRDPGSLASAEWAMAYRETNILFGKLNEYMAKELTALHTTDGNGGTVPVRVALPLGAASMDGETLTSRWSQRHVARIAGLGTFGQNNMLITKNGCSGRYSSFVTNLNATADRIIDEEWCLYKRNGSCGVCIRQCAAKALTADGFDREICAGICVENQNFHDPHMTFGVDSEVCGKCLIDLPCTQCLPG